VPDDDSYIRARFFVTKKAVTIYARYHEVTCTLRWERGAKDLDLQTRHIKTLIANLDKLVADGLQEVVIQAEAAGIDQEWLDLDEPPPTEETP
jgi:hypothetical protein